jgi:hypothetical protein
MGESAQYMNMLCSSEGVQNNKKDAMEGEYRHGKV